MFHSVCSSPSCHVSNKAGQLRQFPPPLPVTRKGKKPFPVSCLRGWSERERWFFQECYASAQGCWSGHQCLQRPVRSPATGCQASQPMPPHRPNASQMPATIIIFHFHVCLPDGIAVSSSAQPVFRQSPPVASRPACSRPRLFFFSFFSFSSSLGVKKFSEQHIIIFLKERDNI